MASAQPIPTSADRRAGGSPRLWPRLRRARRLVQAAAFIYFLVLFFAAQQRSDPPDDGQIFYLLDPLTSAATMLAARAWIADMGLAVATVALTIALGRVWCGWICPFGALLGWIRLPGARRRAGRMPPSLRRAKYLLLAVVAGMAALGSLTLLVLDPIALLTRSLATGLVPPLSQAVTLLERPLLDVPALEPSVSAVDGALRGTVLPVVQPHYRQTLVVLLVLAAIVATNALAPRFWCRYLCPLGALLGLLAKAAVLRPVVGSGCDGCARCARACSLEAIELDRPPASSSAGPAPLSATAGRRAIVVTSECSMCLDCLVACPRAEALGFGRLQAAGPWERYDPSRRQFLAAAAGGLGASILVAAGLPGTRRTPAPLRPPGVHDEDAFLSSCLRCAHCTQVCPTAALQPALIEGGLQGVWSPLLVPRRGYCDFGCCACGQACPSHAIPELPLEQKRLEVIGVAVIDRERCLPWAQGIPCIVCQEMCPTPQKAIKLTKGETVKRPDGGTDWVRRPVMLPERCIGCGICEYKCPVDGRSAIVVRPAGQTRLDPQVYSRA